MLKRYYYNYTRLLYYDIDALSEGIGAIAYYLKGDIVVPKGNKVSKSLVQPIIFLLRPYTQIKKKISATKLEVTALI